MFLLLGGIAGVIVGVAIGATGIGGVLLVPLLAYVLGVPVQTAIPVVVWSKKNSPLEPLSMKLFV